MIKYIPSVMLYLAVTLPLSILFSGATPVPVVTILAGIVYCSGMFCLVLKANHLWD